MKKFLSAAFMGLMISSSMASTSDELLERKLDLSSSVDKQYIVQDLVMCLLQLGDSGEDAMVQKIDNTWVISGLPNGVSVDLVETGGDTAAVDSVDGQGYSLPPEEMEAFVEGSLFECE